MHQCFKNAKLGKIVESGGEATCILSKIENKMVTHSLTMNLNILEIDNMFLI